MTRALLLVWYSVIYARSLPWGWIGLDDVTALAHNENLGRGWRSLWWALASDGTFHRWMPVTWLVFAFVPHSLLAYKLLEFVVGAATVVCIHRAYAAVMSDGAAFVAAALLVSSPMAWEVLGWVMGVEYCLVTMFVCLAFTWPESRWAAGCGVLSILAYPQAVGLLAVLVCVRPACRRWAVSWALVAVGDAVVNYLLRQDAPAVPVSFFRGIVALCHYPLVLVWPFAPSPVFPTVWYPVLWVGLSFLVLGFAVSWRVGVLALLALAPTLLASITEPFWLGGRYWWLAALVVYGAAARGLRAGFGRRGLGGLVAIAVAWACWSTGVTTYRSFADVVLQTRLQARSVGITFRFSAKTRDPLLAAPGNRKEIR